MKTSTATIMGVSALTAAVVGFGATAPSLATNLGLVGASTTDDSSSTDDSSTSGEDSTTDGSWGPGMHGRMGAMHERMGDRGGHMPGHMGGPGQMMETAAETLGLSEDELLTQLQDGSTLGEIADAQGVDRQTLVDALMADHEERITQMLDEQMPMMHDPSDDSSDDSSDDGSDDGSDDSSDA
ncbi:hypothetical protein [Ornithinimicrobium tianjinense]|uniref:Helix-turn-helix domain-containing protein n=1 Tax=Ornithinimicrobium tianjinense TaxID=1195761 RepID=A0A917BVD9_9MICO|nr:hypothetical protein [Ornithinimicrobium tianjinense]GGF58800.1 hypothetical protein GCM10011366_28320 [Ornithinimicrobium tianjinense]